MDINLSGGPSCGCGSNCGCGDNCNCGNSEQFRSCNDCDKTINLDKNAVINPFVYPYSGSWNPDTINAQEYLSHFSHRNTPDHVPETN